MGVNGRATWNGDDQQKNSLTPGDRMLGKVIGQRWLSTAAGLLAVLSVLVRLGAILLAFARIRRSRRTWGSA
jgi:hypothetical protein